ncbi:MAG: DUF4266 domain-containing protein [Chitinophagales bacterium]
MLNHYLFIRRMIMFGMEAAVFILFACACSCKSVKPYQRAYLNDEAMQVGKRPIEKLSSNAHNYREGASGGGKAKSSGGCGCN